MNIKQKTKAIYLKSRAKLINLLTITFGALIIILISAQFTFLRSSNDECLWVTNKVAEKQHKVFFDHVRYGGVTYNAGIRNGDEFVSLNGIKFKSTFDAQRILDTIDEGEYANYEVKRGDLTIITQVRVKKLMNFFLASFSIFSLIWLLVGHLTLTAKPDGKVQKIFYLIPVLGIYIIGTNTLFQKFDYTLANKLWFMSNTFIFNFAFVLAPLLIFRFFSLFPQKHEFVNNKWFVRTIYSAVIIFGLYLNFHMFSQPIKSIADFIKVGQIYRHVNTTYFASLVIGLILFSINFYRQKDKSKRKTLTFIFVSFILTIVSLIYVSVIAPQISDIVFNAPEFYTPVILITLLPISLGYSIFKYQLMDLSDVITRTIMYGSVTVTLAILYFISIYGLGSLIGGSFSSNYQNIITAISFVLFAVIFQTTRERYQEILTKKFFPEQYAYQRLLIDFSKELSGLPGIGNIKEKIFETFAMSLRIDVFALFLKNHENIFSAACSKGVSTNIHEIIIDAEKLKLFLEEKKLSSSLSNLEQNHFQEIFPEQYEEIKSENIYTAIPLTHSNSIIGFLLIGLKYTGHQFTGKDLELIHTVSTQAAVALENARLIEAEAQKIKIERDLQVAKGIQEGLLPKTMPKTERLEIFGKMIPAMHIGGDYFDVIEASSSKLFLAIGDVSGKGLSAALYMTKVQTLLHLYCKIYQSPKQILETMNAELYNSINRAWFITLTLAIVDLDEMKITFARAGHMPTFYSINGKITEYTPKGIGLGLAPNNIFSENMIEQTAPLVKDSLLFFYSDGVNEMMNEKEEIFGNEKIVDCISTYAKEDAETIFKNLWSELETFRGTAEQHDDVTALIVKVK